MLRLNRYAVGAASASLAIAIIGAWMGDHGVVATAKAQERSGGSAVEQRPQSKAPKTYSKYVTIGAVELVRIDPQNVEIRAKIDTGAKSSSIDAQILDRFKRDGADWVRFKIFGDKDATHNFELPITRMVRIRRAGVPRDERPAVTMRICLGPIAADVLVNFAARRELNYRLLLGRDFLENRFLIDAGSTFLTRPSCTKDAPK